MEQTSEIAAEIDRRARLVAGADERLCQTVRQSLWDAFYLGRRCEWYDHMTRAVTLSEWDPLVVKL